MYVLIFNSQFFRFCFLLRENFFQVQYIHHEMRFCHFSVFFIFSMKKKKKNYYYAMPDIHEAIMLLRVGRSTAGLLHSLAGMCVALDSTAQSERKSFLTYDNHMFFLFPIFSRIPRSLSMTILNQISVKSTVCDNNVVHAHTQCNSDSIPCFAMYISR